jgi:hypothetical protein
MSSRRKPQLLAEVLIASFAFALGVVSLLWKDWIEIVFHVNPDRGTGSLTGDRRPRVRYEHRVWSPRCQTEAQNPLVATDRSGPAVSPDGR